MKKHLRSLLALLFLGLFFTIQSCKDSKKIHVLVFSKTEQFRHESIEAGKAAIEKMSAERGFTADFTEDAELFTEKNLKNYHSVIFLNTTGEVLNDQQQEAFERFIQAGGGYVGIHSATDTEYKWAWYGGLAGAYFLDHPMDPSNVQTGKFSVTEKNHWATEGMPEEFDWTDEFYSFRNISPKINVVLTVDESTYKGGKNPDFHPMSWYQEYDGGRSFYTAMGHTDEAFSDPLFLNHLWAGIKYAAGGENPEPVDFSKSRPEENRFTKVVLAERLDEPMELTVLDENRVLFIQRKGEVMLFNTKTNELKEIAKIPVNLKVTNKEGKESIAEDGLLGLNKDPGFAENNWIYLYYSSTEKSANVLVRYEMKGNELLLDSKKEILEVAVQREECCHTGGSIAWDSEGSLYLSTGDNTNPHGSNGFSPSDERPGRSPWDAQQSSANTNDLRGKIIRIKPQPDGTYTIPLGNLFPEGTPKTRPEIYTMGHRNPYRISIDQQTGFLYWGEVGPDSRQADSLRGPAGHDEVGQARAAGNFGWPHFVGDNKAYYRYDFVAEKSMKKWDPAAPINSSPNNTGLEKLPPAQKAFIWYPYGGSEEFPILGNGGRNAMAGPVFYSEDFKNAPNAFPKYYNGKLLIYDWMRGWAMAVTLDEEGNYVSMERFMPSQKFSNPMDMEFAANGDLYMLEYGAGWFSQNEDARLVRIEYNGGNRKPQVQVTANQLGGSVPFDLSLSAKGSSDIDGDELTYTCSITSKEGFEEIIKGEEAKITLSKPGVYQATLTADDGNGGVINSTLQITAGNETPVLTLEMPGSNRTFFTPNQPFNYDVQVTDKEDGTLGKGIDPEQVAVTINYLEEGYDKVIIAQGHRSADESAVFATGKKLIEASDCKSCHGLDKKSIGPTYRDVAVKYQEDEAAEEYLINKIITGGGGVWGETAMAAHPALSKTDASEMVKYILNLANETQASTLPVNGNFLASVPEWDEGRGVYILRAAYEDHGANGLPTVRAEQTFVLRNAKVNVHDFDIYEGIRKVSNGGMNLIIPDKSGTYLILNQVDLDNMKEFQVMAMAPKPQLNSAGGKIELRIGSPTGELLGESKMLEPSEAFDFTPTILSILIKSPTSTSGKLHDLYVVFVNKNSGEQSLMIVMGTEFKLSNSK